ncbi:DEAD-box ATP-dependent RNA helicase 17 [Vitis vinifera]|uniref:ATP-dependent RNA helicase n=1 Tax=Vitis vinifera TaxID=29760 RepID=A0A438E894_VITVI|nr:DEAD-box ATP-dependent RNA helicase 17 [Vitis vinifera]
MLTTKLLFLEVLDTTVCQFLEFKDVESDTSFSGISILVATPGRLLDHLKNTSSFLHTNLRWIIFDEADRILELGFGKEIEEILDLLGSRTNGPTIREDAVTSEFQRQNLLLSATLNEKVNHLAQISLENPVTIGLDGKKMQLKPSLEHFGSVEFDVDDDSEKLRKIINPSNGDYKLPSQLVQRYVKVPCGSRLVVLLSILKHLLREKLPKRFAHMLILQIVVFFSTCDAVDFHYSLFSAFLWPANLHPETEDRQMFLRFKTFQLHGNMKHEDRRSTFQTFKKEKSALLLSTDVAARGLDFPKVRCIIQYDSPGEASEYVHRVGRTARLGERGDSLLFLQPVEMDYLQDLEKHGVSLTEYSLLKVLDSFPLSGQKHHIKKFISLEMHPWSLYLQKALESFIFAEFPYSAQDEEAGQGCILLLGPCIYSPPWHVVGRLITKSHDLQTSFSYELAVAGNGCARSVGNEELVFQPKVPQILPKTHNFNNEGRPIIYPDRGQL